MRFTAALEDVERLLHHLLDHPPGAGGHRRVGLAIDEDEGPQVAVAVDDELGVRDAGAVAILQVRAEPIDRCRRDGNDRLRGCAAA